MFNSAFNLLIFLALICLSNRSKGQDVAPRQIICEFSTDEKIRISLNDLSFVNGKNIQLRIVEQLVPEMNIYLLEYQSEDISEMELLERFQAHEFVKLAQLNHYVSLRSTVPNDPSFNSQWQYVNSGQNGGTIDMDIDADLAWDISTGGLTVSGDTIVVAVIDDGANILHPDLVQNLWVNRFEIPNNNIDDDQNGYVDDCLGWNSNSSDDNVNANGAGGHGTPVAGIIGAKGNNNLGVSGVNWNVKLMLIRNNFNTTEANVLASYGYALQQRKIYNRTNGAQGAFVVATNASWGIDNGNPLQAPLWCAFYDTLGKYGVINIASTTNNNVNVDLVGDLPTTCPSDYLISVSNLNKFGIRLAGYGLNAVDLGAFGESVYTLSFSNYGLFGGTSAATPHVTGAIALAYSAVCDKFMSLARRYPEQAAILMKDAILNGTVPNSSMTSLSVSGGQLNLYNSLIDIQNACPNDSCFAPNAFLVQQITDSTATLSFQALDSFCLRYRLAGSNIWIDSIVSNSNIINLIGLSKCKDYEVLVSGWCNGVVGISDRYTFQTGGCCIAPQNIRLQNSSDNNLSVVWDAVNSAQLYIIRWRPYGQAAWNNLQNNNTFLSISNLSPCSFYEVQIRTDCGDTIGSYSAIQLFSTTGCNSCANLNYCDMRGTLTDFDWLERIRLANFEHRSGKNGGYLLYDSTYISLQAGENYPLCIEQGNNFLEAVRIWLDLNQDNDFGDADEKVFEGMINFTDSLNSTIYIPNSAIPGMTRMRVALQWNSYPNLCTQYQNGETEDYCVLISPSTAVNIIENPSTITLFPNPSSGKFNISNIPADCQLIRLVDLNGKILFTQKISSASDNLLSLDIDVVLSEGIYILESIGDNFYTSNKVVLLKR